MVRPDAKARIYLYRDTFNMRISVIGLFSIVEAEMSLNPFSAGLFIFCNRRRSIVMMVVREGNGFALLMKRRKRSVKCVLFIMCFFHLKNGVRAKTTENFLLCPKI